MQDLANSIEAALKYRVEQGAFDVSIFTGQSDYTKANPSLVIHAEAGDEFPLGSGNFYVTVNCELRLSVEESKLSDWTALERNVFGQLMASDLCEKLSQEADDLHVFGIRSKETRSVTDENQWLSVITFTFYCCLTDV
jgi:hypothetical protein